MSRGRIPGLLCRHLHSPHRQKEHLGHRSRCHSPEPEPLPPLPGFHVKKARGVLLHLAGCDSGLSSVLEQESTVRRTCTSARPALAATAALVRARLGVTLAAARWTPILESPTGAGTAPMLSWAVPIVRV